MERSPDAPPPVTVTQNRHPYVCLSGRCPQFMWPREERKVRGKTRLTLYNLFYRDNHLSSSWIDDIVLVHQLIV